MPREVLFLRETRLEGDFTWAKKGTGMNAATGSQRRMSDIMASWPYGVPAGSYDSRSSDSTRRLNSLSFSITVQELVVDATECEVEALSVCHRVIDGATAPDP